MYVWIGSEETPKATHDSSYRRETELLSALPVQNSSTGSAPETHRQQSQRYVSSEGAESRWSERSEWIGEEGERVVEQWERVGEQWESESGSSESEVWRWSRWDDKKIYGNLNMELNYCKHRNLSDLTIVAITATKLKTLLMFWTLFIQRRYVSYIYFSDIYSRSLFLVFIKDKSLKILNAIIQDTAILEKTL